MIACDEDFLAAKSYEEKISRLIGLSSDSTVEHHRIGSLVFLFELIYNFRETLSVFTFTLILEEMFNHITAFFVNYSDEVNTVFCVLEIIGKHDKQRQAN